MQEETAELIRTYSRDPVNNYAMQDATVTYRQGNDLCGDYVIVFLRIDDEGMVREFSYTGDLSLHTIAAASLLAEYMSDVSVDVVLDRTYQTVKQRGFDVSIRRQRSAVTALLATRNAIHQRKNDGIIDTYELLLDI